MIVIKVRKIDISSPFRRHRAEMGFVFGVFFLYNKFQISAAS